MSQDTSMTSNVNKAGECVESQFRIIFIHNGKDYDTKYLQSKYFQDTLKKYNMDSQPYKNKDAGKIVGLALACRGFWFDKECVEIDFAVGPYMYVFMEIMKLSHPIECVGKVNGCKLTDELWSLIVKKNPFVVNKIHIWKSLYNSHLTNTQTYSQIRIRTFHAPFGILDCIGVKPVENQSTFSFYKIDPVAEQKIPKNIRCRECVNAEQACDSCISCANALNTETKKKNKKQQSKK